MKLIDNRYKINRLIKDSTYYTIYEAVDIWDSDRKLFLKVYNPEKQGKVIDYFINNYINMSRIKHTYLLECKQFSIVKSIDGRKVKIKQYYSTSEYTDAPSLEEISGKLSFEEKINIILRICTVLDYLHHRGIAYKLLSPSHIFLNSHEDLKIVDLATIYEDMVNSDYDNITRFFIAPEVILQQENKISSSADKYSLGMLIAYLFTDNFFKDEQMPHSYKHVIDMNEYQIDFMNHVIKILTNKNPFVRDIEIKSLINDIKRVFNVDYEYDMIKERGFLDFETKIVGRENEIKKMLENDESVSVGNKDIKMIMVCGEEGIGKTRLLKEISYLLRMKGREVYSIEINDNNNSNLMPLTEILRQTIKDTPKQLMEKYAREFTSVLPELKLMLGNNIVNGYNDHKYRLRLYDRVTNYFADFTNSKEELTYLIIDNIEKTTIDFLYLIDYLLRNISYGNLVLIVSCDEKTVLRNSDKYDVFYRWLNRDYIENIKISNLNLDEIGEFVQHILGINYKPLKFAAVLLKESRGNPRYIEYMIKDLYAKGELYFNEEGFWDLKAQNYSDIYFPSSLDEALKSQLEIIEKKHMYIMKILSAYKSSVSKVILSRIVDIGDDNLNKILQELTSMRLIDEMVSDWGFSYSINNVRLKKLIYYRIPKDEKERIHNRIAQLLEEYYRNDYEIIIEELIHHLVASNQREKAVNIILDLIKKQENVYGTKSLLLWEEAYEISQNTEITQRIDILEALGKIYFMRGKNEKALEIYEELHRVGIKLNKLEYCIMANIGITEVYLQLGLNYRALEKAQETIIFAEQIGYIRGIAESKLLHCKVLFFSKKMEKLQEYIDEVMNLAIENNISEILGNLYNLIGLYQYYLGNAQEAIDNYKKSVKYFHEYGYLIDSTKPMNNIAVIYFDLGQYDNAMEYYKNALAIVDKQEVLNLKLVFLNNIGEIYMTKCQYEKAKSYFEEAREIAIEIEDGNGILITSLNLGFIFLYTNKYDQAFNYYKILKEEYSKEKNISFEVESQYYHFLGEYYFTFGKWDEAKTWYLKAKDQYKQYDISGYLISKSRLLQIDCLKEGKFDKKEFDKIRAEFRNKSLNYLRRKFLLYLGILAFMEKDYDYLKDILAEDEQLKNDYFAKDFEYFRQLLINGMKDDEDSYNNLIKLEEEAKKHNLENLAIIINIILGNRACERDNHFQSFKFYVEALDLIYRLIKNVPVRDLQVSFTRTQKSDKIKDKLSQAIYRVFNEKIKWIRLDELKDKDNIEKYFDYSSLLDLTDKIQFAKIVENNILYGDIKDILDIPSLISELTDDYKYNLELILKFIGKETLAQRGCILIYDETKNEYIPIVEIYSGEKANPNQNLLALASRYDKGILLSTSLESNVIGLYKELLPKNTKALICIPIAIKENKIHVKHERRKNGDWNVQKSQGFILLETDRLFNRFDEKRVDLIRNLINIIFINIENYKLKILSTIDRLTGTHTRKYFENELSNRINEAKRNQSSFALAIIDIDNFKNVNDTYGHRVGDLVLSRIGNYLVNNIRKTDIIARYGGEEFVILLNDVEEEQAINIAENIRKGISQLNISNVEHTITVSIGVSLFPKHTQFKEELLIKADQALYSAKRNGKNRVVLWNTNLSNALDRVDRLAGILTGNINIDQTNVLAILDTISIVKDSMTKDEKIFLFLGKVIEVLQAEYCTLIELGKDENILFTYSRKRFVRDWTENCYINYKIVDDAIKNRKGEFLIDWDTGNDTMLNLSTPNWQSVIVLPLINDNKIKGIGYITVPIKEKEFDYNSYNLAKSLWDIFSTIM